MNPPFLQENDEIRIISPSGAIDNIYIDGVKNVLQCWGFTVTEGVYARGKYERFAGTPEQRLEDLQNALDSSHVKAILCSRGGYGLAQIIDKVDFTLFRKNPKWIIGFSDITALHSAVSHTGISSIHGIMAKHLTELSVADKAVLQLKEILSGKLPVYSLASHPLNIKGEIEGKIIGGNLSVLAGLRATPFDYDYKNKILFIEDVGEEPYCIDRMMQNLRLSGILSKISGLIIGQFNDEEEDTLKNIPIYESVHDIISAYNIPVCFNFPIGHVSYNLPIIVGADAKLNITDNNVTLIQK